MFCNTCTVEMNMFTTERSGHCFNFYFSLNRTALKYPEESKCSSQDFIVELWTDLFHKVFIRIIVY